MVQRVRTRVAHDRLTGKEAMNITTSARGRHLAAVAGATLLAVTLALSTPPPSQAQSTRADVTTAPIAKGQKIVMATHSFNVFVGPSRGGAGAGAAPNPGPLAALAVERGKAGHETLAVQMIGG